MNETRLKNIYFYIKNHANEFDMETVDHDFAYYAACVATGEDLEGKQAIEYRGRELHLHDVVAEFLQVSEEEAEKLIYLGQWPDAAYQIYKRKDRLKGLLYMVNTHLPMS